MAKSTHTVNLGAGISEIWLYDSDEPDYEYLIFYIDRPTQLIYFYPRQPQNITTITLEGFDRLPPEFAEKGYIRSGLLYYIDKKIAGWDVESITISKTRRDDFRKVGQKYRVVINYESFQRLKNRVARANYKSKIEKSHLVDEFFHLLFPSKYDPVPDSARRRAKNVIENLDAGIIEYFDSSDTSKLLDFFESFLDSRYVAPNRRAKLFSAAKLKVNDVALRDLIKNFESLLEVDPQERKWGEFLEKELFLIDSSYVGVLPELNVVLATDRRADFGLIDSQGYLDLFEIKRPTTKLLEKRTDRGNYFWSKDAIKAIVQAEKYLFHAERKADSLASDVKRHYEVEISIIRPRVFVIMGSIGSFQSEAEQEDFRILRRSFKNIEIFPYDELLQSLKNQQGKLYPE